MFLLLALAAAFIIWCGYRDTRHNSIVWCDEVPRLYVPIFYNADSLNHYIDIAFLDEQEDAEAFAIVGTATYNLLYFDKRAQDSLPVVPLEDADMMLLGAAYKGYAPAFTVLRYLDIMGVWHHSIPSNEPTIFPSAPSADDPDYVYMTVKK